MGFSMQGVQALFGDSGSEVALPLQKMADAVSSPDESIVGLLESWDLPGAKHSISGLVRALGFGPEADGIATVLIGLFVVLVIVGYAAGPKNSDETVVKKKDDTTK